MKLYFRLPALLLGVFAALAGQPAVADDSEVFTSASFVSNRVRPNVLFIIDTSGSMDTYVEGYNRNITYPAVAGCPQDRILWRTGNHREPPACNTNQWIPIATNRCRAAANGMASGGWWSGRTQQMLNGRNYTYWGNAEPGNNTGKFECQTDHNNHGDLPGTSPAGTELKYARNGNDNNRWGNSTSQNRLSWGNLQTLSLYSPNYLNWYYGTGSETGTPPTRLDVVRDAAKTLIDRLNGVNLGLMRYSTNAQGGMVTYPISRLTATSREEMKTELNNYRADGYTPLAETLYEAHQYFKGSNVHFGASSTVGYNPDNDTYQTINKRSVAGSRVGGDANAVNYQSPMEYSCQNNFIVYLTDGLPTEDNAADPYIEGGTIRVAGVDVAVPALPDFAEDGGTCPAQIDDPDPSYLTSGRCLESLTRYMKNHDLRSDVLGDQTVTSYYVGFGRDIARSAQFLNDVAAAGGGTAYTAEDSPGLVSTLEEIFNEVLDSTNTTFVSPAVSVNAFNRTQNFNDLFVSVFGPSKQKHWPGNLKKYRIIDGEIYGTSTTDSAVDPLTGFFSAGSKALNTPAADPADGFNARLGGSAARLDSWRAGARDVYTYLPDAPSPSTDLSNSANAFEVSNTALTFELLGAPAEDRRQDVIEFTRGRDLRSTTDDTGLRKRMGDPMHARPAIVVYSGTADAPVGTVFTPTNDGMLHAFDMATGDELWAFIPHEFLGRLNALYDDPPQAVRDYALDGDIRVFKYDVDQDGVVETADGDKVYLFFGTGRGGSYYYSLDVTDREAPEFRWMKSSADMPKLGKTWSPPTIARVDIEGSGQSTQKFVLIFGGGYNVNQDGYAYTTDNTGNAVFMLDLETGRQLWSASDQDADLELADMTHSIPAGISVLDTDGDRFADRMYASDTGGRLWRFDIWNGKSVPDLVTGGVLANLGAAGTASPLMTVTRRFYNTPDAAPISLRGSRPFINIAIGSGYRGHPLDAQTQDRFYSIRDYSPFTKRTNESYTATGAVITESQLANITDSLDVPVRETDKGWMIELREGAGDWRGEKVLADSVTASGVIFFPTFTPLGQSPTEPCLTQTANRVYAVYAATGKPFTRWDERTEGEMTVDDRHVDLAQKGIAPSVSILSNPSDPTNMGICQVGAQILNRCVKFGTTVRSYWEHR